MSEVETNLVVSGTQNTGNPTLDSVVNLALEMIRKEHIAEKDDLIKFCEDVYPALKGLQ